MTYINIDQAGLLMERQLTEMENILIINSLYEIPLSNKFSENGDRTNYDSYMIHEMYLFQPK